ncbi:hypothetical protein Pint_34224 [Pistacia integerrima]|uniref:Uncharacterized protein n=1 Tax=Pistacia integerrima TaxID=434235 RepID=A0ACC0X6W5_9ROSI|nr:hypothetical protein Pint_34224 [Pistacia integerrima]
MGLKVIGEGKRGFWPFKSRNQTSSMKSNVMEAISQVNGYGGVNVVSQANKDGVVRMKIVVKKEDLKQMIDMKRGSENNAHGLPSSLPSPSPVERRLHLLERRHLLRVNNSSKENRRGYDWHPVLPSIPEEL